MQGQAGGLGGFMQGNAGKYAMGALGGAAAVIGGEMLFNGVVDYYLPFGYPNWLLFFLFFQYSVAAAS